MAAPVNKKIRLQAVAKALSLLEKMTPHGEIVKQIAEEFQVSVQTGYDWLARAYAQMHENDKPLVSYRKARNRKAMERVAFHAMKMAEGTGQSTWANVCINAFDKLAKLDGLYEPEAVSIEDKRKRPENMSPRERQAEIARLLAKRHAAGIPDPDTDKAN